ncbi:hypothetical protein ILUMI_22332 [Ignelater luminosus]|uniref:Uncharacterized protein n=1 Tax=Ignelater luminosus TaxID=2038154 RepID=A0A8K0FXG0_IGNLU|nr:hypothetical protein ILUMI_22332 [Ignelater luminosus]
MALRKRVLSHLTDFPSAFVTDRPASPNQPIALTSRNLDEKLSPPRRPLLVDAIVSTRRNPSTPKSSTQKRSKKHQEKTVCERRKRILAYKFIAVWAVKRSIEKMREGFSVKDKARSARPEGPSDVKLEKKIVKCMERHRTALLRNVARKLGVSHSFINKIKKRNNIKTFKKQKCAKRSEKQHQ